MDAERWDEQVGSVADEASRLLESLRRSAAEAAAHGAAGDHPADAVVPEPGSAAPSQPGAPHDPFCAWCPLCRGAAVVRSLSPETLARLADLAALAATVLTDLAGSRAEGRTAPAHPEDATGGDDRAGAAAGDPENARTAPRPRPTRRARRTPPAQSRPIPVSDADDPQEAPRG